MRQLLTISGKLSVLTILILSSLNSCVKDETTRSNTLAKNETNQIALDWMNLSLTLTKDAPGFTAPVAARTFAYLGLGMYETIVPGSENIQSMGGKFQGLSSKDLPTIGGGGEMNWSIAVNECMYNLTMKFYKNTTPSNLELIQGLYSENLSSATTSLNSEVIRRSSTFGQKMAVAIFNYSLTDNQEHASLNNYPDSYTSPRGQGLWSPTNSGNQKPLQPYWGSVRTFVKQNSELQSKQVLPPFSLDENSEFYRAALEVKNRVKNLSHDEENLVRYWNDEQKESLTSAGHLISILSQILDKENKDLEFTALAFMKLSVSLHDATVATWKTKFTYNTIRPENYIQSYIDDNFLSLINTPATPEYSCGQASLAFAASEVMSTLFGHTYAFTDNAYEYRKDIDGSPRAFKSFSHMANEISMSNLYGGIHYRFSLVAGQNQGEIIGRNIINL